MPLLPKGGWIGYLDADAAARAPATAEPRTLRYRLLHTAGRLVHRSRQVLLRLPEHWPWANELAHAYQRLGLLTI